jgi:uncharacterized protein (TIGR02145 family)
MGMGKLGLKLVFLMVILIEASIVMSQGDIKSVKIGNQVWMAENLNVDRYRNGDPINTGLTDQQWKVTTQGAFAIYDNIQANDLVYGKLYNWYAVVDPRGLCPSGWHVPSDDEWTILTDYLGGWKVAGGKLKFTSVWDSPNSGATNSTGFTGLPAGFRSFFGVYKEMGQYGYFLSSTKVDDTYVRGRTPSFNGVALDATLFFKNDGFSVRCIKD